MTPMPQRRVIPFALREELRADPHFHAPNEHIRLADIALCVRFTRTFLESIHTNHGPQRVFGLMLAPPGETAPYVDELQQRPASPVHILTPSWRHGGFASRGEAAGAAWG